MVISNAKSVSCHDITIFDECSMVRSDRYQLIILFANSRYTITVWFFDEEERQQARQRHNTKDGKENSHTLSHSLTRAPKGAGLYPPTESVMNTFCRCDQ